MPAEKLHRIGAATPAGFPCEPYENILLQLRAKNAAWVEPTLFDAWGAVASRFRSCADHHARYGGLAAAARAGTLDADGLHQLHETLFGFFVAGSAVIDSFCYGVYAVGSHTVTPGFSLTSPSARRKVTPGSTLDRLTELGRHLRITRELGDLLGSGEYQRWVKNRDELAQRVAPLRSSVRPGGAPRPAFCRWRKFDSGDVIRVDPAATRSRLTWLSASLRKLLEGAEEFTRDRLASLR